jgi:hypothetical protein
LKIVMMVAAVNETVETKAEGPGLSVEPDQNLISTVLGEEFIKNLPDNEEDLRDFLQTLAGLLAGGQRGAQILVDVFGGGRLPPREAIRLIRSACSRSRAARCGGASARLSDQTRRRTPGIKDAPSLLPP